MDEDIAEFEHLLTLAKRPRTKDALSSALATLKAEKAKSSAASTNGSAAAAPAPAPAPAPAAAPIPARAPPAPAVEDGGVVYEPLDSFAWDQGEYNSPWVSVYVSVEGASKERTSCDFTESSFDLRVLDVAGKNYRLRKDNLDKAIVPAESKVIVKKSRVVIKLRKVKGEYSYDHWTDLCAKRAKDPAKKDDPMGGIMDMMKDMYDSGDDQMKKTIGEAMLKANNKDKSADPALDDPMSGMGGMGGLGGMGGMGGLGGMGGMGGLDDFDMPPPPPMPSMPGFEDLSDP